MTDTHTTKKVEAKNPRSKAANRMAIAGDMPMHIALEPMDRNASTDSDSVGNPGYPLTHTTRPVGSYESN